MRWRRLSRRSETGVDEAGDGRLEHGGIRGRHQDRPIREQSRPGALGDDGVLRVIPEEGVRLDTRELAFAHRTTLQPRREQFGEVLDDLL